MDWDDRKHLKIAKENQELAVELISNRLILVINKFQESTWQDKDDQDALRFALDEVATFAKEQDVPFHAGITFSIATGVASKDDAEWQSSSLNC